MALTANMHALVEPPMTTDLNEAKQLAGEADSAWVKLCTAQDQRSSAVHQTIAYLLNAPARVAMSRSTARPEASCGGCTRRST